MAFKTTWWSSLKDIDDETFRNIVKRGKIEDLMSKERIDTRFGSTVEDIISNVRSLDTNTNQFVISIGCNQLKIQQVLKLVKRMPKLDDGLLLKDWSDEESLSQLAAVNQSLGRCYGPDIFYVSRGSSLTRYIQSVKNSNPDYDAGMVEYGIELDKALPLLEKFQDMKLKLAMRGSQMASPYSRMCYILALKHPSDRLDDRQSYPSVKAVAIHEYGHLSDLALLPNLQALFVIAHQKVTIKVRNILPYLRSKLRILVMQLKSWDAGDFIALTTIINTHPLIEFRLDITEKYPEREILNMILNSATTKLDTLVMNSFRFRRENIYIGTNTLQQFFADKELLRRLLSKFKLVEYFIIRRNIYPVTLYQVMDVLHRVQSTDHRRSIRILIC